MNEHPLGSGARGHRRRGHNLAIAPAAGATPALVVGHHFAKAGGHRAEGQCIAAYGIACYAPQDIRNQYDFNPEYAAGNDGSGQTIVIFDSFGSQTIKSDLATFDQSYGIYENSSVFHDITSGNNRWVESPDTRPGPAGMPPPASARGTWPSWSRPCSRPPAGTAP